MKKITVDIGKVAKGMRLKYSLILDADETGVKNPSLSLINHYKIGGNEFFKFNPHPYLTIDISESFGKKEEWNANKSVNLNLMSKMKMEAQLKIVISNLSIKELFYYDKNNKLDVNRDVVKSLNMKPFVIGNKNCMFDYGVIRDDKNNEYEGIIFMINSADNFCMLTIDEISYLYYVLLSTNLYNLTFSVLSYYNTLDKTNQLDEIEIKPQLIQEEQEMVPKLNRVPEYDDQNMPDLSGMDIGYFLK